MGMINSSLRAENQALRDEVQFLRKALAEARQRAGFPSDDVEEPVFTERPTKVQILKERRSSLGELPFIGRAEKIVEGVLPLAAAFDKFDGDGSGGIDGNELRAALEYLGVPVTSEQASSILRQYDDYPDRVIDVKEFATIVRDIKLLLEFDRNKDGVLDADELHAALESLGLQITAVQTRRILHRFDANASGTIDLFELSSLVRTVQAFTRYDTDQSGAIDVDELRSALRKLGLRAGALEAQGIFRRYDADESGTIELHEFAVLVRDLQLYAAFDTNCDGLIDLSELIQVMERLGLKSSLEETATVVEAWDPTCDGNLDLPSFSQFVADVRIFKDQDANGKGQLDGSQMRAALRELGVDISNASAIIQKHETNGLTDLVGFAAVVREVTRRHGAMREATSVGFDNMEAVGPAAAHKSKLTGSGTASDEERAMQQHAPAPTAASSSSQEAVRMLYA